MVSARRCRPRSWQLCADAVGACQLAMPRAEPGARFSACHCCGRIGTGSIGLLGQNLRIATRAPVGEQYTSLVFSTRRWRRSCVPAVESSFLRFRRTGCVRKSLGGARCNTSPSWHTCDSHLDPELSPEFVVARARGIARLAASGVPASRGATPTRRCGSWRGTRTARERIQVGR